MSFYHRTPKNPASPSRPKANSGHQRSTPSLNIRNASPAKIMELQRLIGNRAVQRLIAEQSALIQRNPVTDRLEKYMDDVTQAPETRIIAQHILNVIAAINGGQWQTAYDLLTNNGIAGIVKAKIKIVKFSVFDRKRYETELFRAMKAGQYKPEGKEITLPDMEIAYMDEMDLHSGGMQDMKTPANDQQLAMTFLPVMLEEWIHMFQYHIGGFVSYATESFERNKANEITANGWNLKEVDIYAIYRDLKWFAILDEFRSRYTERQKFEEFSPTWKRAYPR